MDKIFFPLKYLFLSNKWKNRFEVGSALALAFVISLPYFLIADINYFHPNGFLDKLLTLTSCLTGFYIAALVASATLQIDDLDEPIRFGAVYIRTTDENGKAKQVPLSRRQFVCYMFGYLSFLSLAISLASAYCVSIGGTISLKNVPAGFSQIGWWVRCAAILSANFGVCHLLVVSNVGIYYMMHRIFKTRPKIITKKNNAA